MIHKEFSLPGNNGLKYFSQQWLPESEINAVIALIHGLGEHSRRYLHVADYFTQKGLAFVSFDLYGHGKSGGKRGHLPSEDTYLSSIDELLQYIKIKFPNKPIFLYGHSLGGEIVLWYSMTRKPKINGVIATAPFLSSFNAVNPLKLFTARAMNNIYPSFVLNSGLEREALSRDLAIIQAYNDDPLVHGSISARLGWMMIEKGEWLLEHAHEFPLPLLLMVGSKERIVNVEKINHFARAIPKERLDYKIWEGLYHELHNEPEKKQVFDYEFGWIKHHIN